MKKIKTKDNKKNKIEKIEKNPIIDFIIEVAYSTAKTLEKGKN
jgi:hypothetical protein